jgi:hypothetical protein
LKQIADALARGKAYPMLADEPQRCAETMYYVLLSLWRIRSERRG